MKALVKYYDRPDVPEELRGRIGVVDGWVCKDGEIFAVVIFPEKNEVWYSEPKEFELIKYVNEYESK